MNTKPPSPLALTLRDELVSTWKAVCISEHRVAQILAELHAHGLHHELGYASVVALAEDLLGMKRSRTEVLLRIGLALPAHPEMDKALAEGRLDYTKARDILPRLTPETEAAWVERACEVNSRDLEALIASTPKGAPPGSHVEPPLRPQRVRLVFECDAADAEKIMGSVTWARAAAGVKRADIDDGAVLASLCERAVHATEVDPIDEPTFEPYRLVVEHCPDCGATKGLEHELSDTVISEATCDAELVDLREGPDRGKVAHAIPERTRRAVMHRDRYRCRVPGCRNPVWVHLHHLRRRSDGGTNDEENLLVMCSIHHRIHHDGRLGVERVGNEVIFTFPTGRTFREPIDARRARGGHHGANSPHPECRAGP